MNETISINKEPFSFVIALNGFNIPFLVVWRFKVYAPAVINITPAVPDLSGSSPNIKKEVKIRNTGVKARKGIDKERGDSFNALI